MPEPLAAIGPGTRLRLCPPGQPGRIGMALGEPRPCSKGGQSFVDVLTEGSASSKPESWPLCQVVVLPQAEQLERLGGRFRPPRGYPLRLQGS